MSKIHGYSESKFKSFISVNKDQKWYILKNTKVFFKRTWQAISRWEIITDRKLAEWAIEKLEYKQNNKKPLPDKIKNICADILPKITKNKHYANLKARYDALVPPANNDASVPPANHDVLVPLPAKPSKDDVSDTDYDGGITDDDGSSSSESEASVSDDGGTHADTSASKKDSSSSSQSSSSDDDDFGRKIDDPFIDDAEDPQPGIAELPYKAADSELPAQPAAAVDDLPPLLAEAEIPVKAADAAPVDDLPPLLAEAEIPVKAADAEIKPSGSFRKVRFQDEPFLHLPHDMPLDQAFIGPSWASTQTPVKKPSKQTPLSQSFIGPSKPSSPDLAHSADDILLKVKAKNLSSSTSLTFPSRLKKTRKKNKLDKKQGVISQKSIAKILNPKTRHKIVLKKVKEVCDKIKQGADIDKDDAKKILERLYDVQHKLQEQIDNTDDEGKIGNLEERIGNLEESLNKLIDMSNYIDAMVLASEFSPDSMTSSFDGSNITQEQPTLGGRVKHAFGTLLGYLGSTARNLNEADKAEVNRVKASKYERLLEILSISLDDISKVKQEGKRMDLEVLGKLQGVLAASNVINSEKSDLSYLTHVRDAFEYDALNGLRDAIVICEVYPDDVTKELKSRVYQAAYDLYTTNDMLAETEALLEMLTNYPGRKDYSDMESSLKHYDYELFKRLEYTSKVIDKAPAVLTTFFSNRAARSVKDYFSLGFSPIAAGNPPQLLDTLNLMRNGMDHAVNIIGMGSPTIQPWSTALTHNAEIDPIFIGMQRHMESLGEHHFYISLQDATSGEKKRNIPIMQAQDVLPSLYAITLSKNTHFYEGEGPSDKEEFMEELHRQVFDCAADESGCHIPEKVRTKIKEVTGEFLEETSVEILVELEECFFPDTDTLTKEEREHLIELYYNLLVVYITVNLDIDHINFTCKDGIDRGMGALAWFAFLFTVLNNQENDGATIEMLKRTLYTRAYWTRKRNIISSRKNRFMHDAKWLLDQLKDDARRAKFEALVNKFMPGVTEAGLQSLATK